MPGYIMHLAEGRLLEPHLVQRGLLKGERALSLFQNGLLLPDTKRKKEKQISHFWNENDLDKLAIAPDLELFYKKYQQRLHEPALLGYWAHLHLDNCFVKVFWPDNFCFLDEAGNEQELWDRIRQVKLKKTGQIVPVNDFYSKDWYYGDYSRMNSRFIREYSITIPAVEDGCADAIEEVSAQDLYIVKKELTELCAHREKNEPLRVFSPEGLDVFLKETAEKFLKLL